MLSDSFGSTPDQSAIPESFIDDFSRKALDTSWYQLRTPYTRNFKLRSTLGSSERQDKTRHGISFIPNVFGLSERDTPAAILRKQSSLNMTFSATLIPTEKTLNTRQSVGISSYLSELQHFDIGIRGCANTTGICIYTQLLFNQTITVSRA